MVRKLNENMSKSPLSEGVREKQRCLNILQGRSEQVIICAKDLKKQLDLIINNMPYMPQQVVDSFEDYPHNCDNNIVDMSKQWRDFAQELEEMSEISKNFISDYDIDLER